jgi:hypothetical protein
MGRGYTRKAGWFPPPNPGGKTPNPQSVLSYFNLPDDFGKDSIAGPQ